MAEFVYSADNAPFPDGTVVGAYPRDRFALPQPSGVPVGSPVSSGTVAASSVTFTGLTRGEQYWLVGDVSGTYRYKAIQVAPFGQNTLGKIADVMVDGVEAGDILGFNSDDEWVPSSSADFEWPDFTDGLNLTNYSDSPARQSRTPVYSSIVQAETQTGARDYVAHTLQSLVMGDWSDYDGPPSPGHVFNINGFTVTGTGESDGQGITALWGALFETAIASPNTDIGLVLGLAGEASFFGEDAGGTVEEMVSLQASAPSRKGGATGGVAETAISFRARKAVASAVGATMAYTIKGEGGYNEILGNTLFQPDTVDDVAVTIKGYPGSTEHILDFQNGGGAQVARVGHDGSIASQAFFAAYQGNPEQVAIGLRAVDAAFKSGIIFGSGADTALYRDSAGIVGTEGGLLFHEHADIAAPAANKGIVYMRDTGGKTELVVRFPTGAVQQIAIEP